MNLRERLFDCLPAGRYAFSGLLRLLDVVETAAVPSAAVECRAQPRILVNPAFVAAHAETPEKLMMLVMHELHHVLLGHTRRLGRSTPADNFVFDCVINALLSRMFPQSEYTALFRDYYSGSRFPECFLRPPDDWNLRAHRGALPPALKRHWKGVARAREAYRALYSKEGASYDEIRAILPLVTVLGVKLEQVSLLGGHGNAADGIAATTEAALAQALGGIVAGWPTPPDPLRGESLRELLRSSRVVVHRPTSNRERLRRLIRKIAGAEGHGGRHRQPALESAFVESPLPVADRRALVSRALGFAPLLYRSEIVQPASVPVGERVHVYVDVSGSMDAVKGAIYGAVLDCAPWVAPAIHLFSTAVVDASLKEIRAGFCRSTDGTDIACVAEHVRANRVRRAVLLTDGCVGEASPDDAAVLAGARIGVAFTHGHQIEDLARFARESVVLSLGQNTTNPTG